MVTILVQTSCSFHRYDFSVDLHLRQIFYGGDVWDSKSTSIRSIKLYVLWVSLESSQKWLFRWSCSTSSRDVLGHDWLSFVLLCCMRSGSLILSFVLGFGQYLRPMGFRMVGEITVKLRPYTKTGSCAWSCTTPNCGIVRERQEKFLERRWRAPCFSSPRDRALCCKLPLTTVLCFNSLLRPSTSFHYFLRRTSWLL